MGDKTMPAMLPLSLMDVTDGIPASAVTGHKKSSTFKAESDLRGPLFISFKTDGTRRDRIPSSILQ